MIRLKDNKGSTLMLIVITIAILSVLGTALLSMTLMNVNMKQSDYRIKQSVYYAESGIDQVYARIGKIVEDGIEYAIAETDTEMQQILQYVDEMIDDPNLMTTNPHMPYAGLIDGEGMLDKTQFEADAQDIYKRHFRTYLNNLDSDADPDNDIGEVLDDSNVNYIYLDSNNPSHPTKPSNLLITFDSIEEFPDVNNPGEFVIKGVTSEFEMADRTTKRVKTDIVITDNITSYPVQTLESRIRVMDNPIWQQPLVAHQNIEIESDAVINGDVYGYGTIPANTETADPGDFGGIIIGDDNSVTVDGDLFTRSYVQLGEGLFSNYNSADLTVNNGLIYANSLVVQKYASGDLLVNGAVYTKDDLEMNGTNASSVTINGSYYGYSDGSNPGTTHDGSSAIVLNSDMSQATLTITGTPSGVMDHDEVVSGIVIGGTAYVDVEPTRFQTSESVSLKGNYLAYTWAFSDLDIQNIMDDTNFLITENLFSNQTDKTNYVDNFLSKENVSWQSVTGSIAKFASGSTISGSSSFKEKAGYFLSFEEFIDQGSGNFIKTGGANINLSNYEYTTGLQLIGQKFEYNPSDINDYDDLKTKIIDDYLYQAHQMTYRLGDNTSNIEDVWNGAAAEAPTISNINVVEKYTSIDLPAGDPVSLSLPFVKNEATTSIINGQPAREIIHISQSVADLHLYGAGTAFAGPDTLTEVLLGENAQGIILRKGDIYIYGDLNFAGTIITTGNIYLQAGNQTFYNNNNRVREFIANLIYTEDEVYDQFEVTTYNGSGTTPVNLGELEFVEVNYTEPTFNDASNSVFGYDEWIHFKYWTVDR